MKICVLASGSQGNCTYIEDEDAKILIDIGISAKQLKKKLSCIGTDISEIDCAYITHEHIDHIRGKEQVEKRFNMPVMLEKKLSDSKKSFSINQKMLFSSLEITPIATSHDAQNPCGFTVQNKKKCAGVFTDLGYLSDSVKNIIPHLDAMVLEANHDIDMLLNGPYPEHLKKRILSNVGHLSNIEAGIAIRDNASEKLKKVFLAHLSRHNNAPDIAMKTFDEITSPVIRPKIIMTDQFDSTELEKV
jgi:phosphoribosyl 1,2-cyclic phosphodiesterase